MGMRHSLDRVGALLTYSRGDTVKMEDVMGNKLTVQELAVQREEIALLAAAESTLEGFKIADRERSGCLVTQRGRLIRKRKREGAYVSEVKSTLHSASVTQRSQVQVQPGVEVRAWNAMVKADRVLVAMGCRSALVKVIKGVRSATALELAMVAANTAE